MRWILIVFGLLDGYLVVRHGASAFNSALQLFYNFQFDILTLIVFGHVLLFATLFFTMFGVPFQKKWALILSYFQVPLRFAYATFTFGFLYLLIPYLPANMPSKPLFITGIAGLFELVRTAITVVVHRRLCNRGKVNSKDPLGKTSKIVISIIGLIFIFATGVWLYYALSGRLCTSLHSALRQNDFPAVKLFLSREPEQLNKLDDFGEAPLHIAIWMAEVTSDPAIVEYLLKQGANPNIYDDWHNTPLHKAAGNLQLTRLLLKHGADPTVRNKS